MSLRRGAPPRGPPVHQNAYAFKHNKNSRKTKDIKRIQHSGLCTRCRDKIEWRKKFRKYKPLKAPSKCNSCEQKAVKRAYHTICDPCSKHLGKCAKCTIVLTDENTMVVEKPEGAFQLPSSAELKDMSERERRTVLRKAAAAVGGGKGPGEGGKAGGGDGDEEEEEEGDMDDEMDDEMEDDL